LRLRWGVYVLYRSEKALATAPIGLNENSAIARRQRQDPCLLWAESRPSASRRLFCFHHAGGAATAYRRWVSLLPRNLELICIQLPGRENRFREPFARDVESLVESLAESIVSHLDRPFVFFGHSMGALVAFELARLLEEQGKPSPTHLAVSACPAPHLPDRRKLSHLEDSSLLEEIQRMGGSPKEFFENEELRELLLPILRADFRLCDTYRYREGPPLACSITALGGEDDPWADQDDLTAWAGHTVADFTLKVFPGDHFYFQGSEAQVLGELLEMIGP
jgi:medium-chain acyl-[acyl-carrier-protein] hydrolase